MERKEGDEKRIATYLRSVDCGILCGALNRLEKVEIQIDVG